MLDLRACWAHVAQQEGLQALARGGLLAHFSVLLGRRSCLSPAEKQKLLYAATGGLWTQARAHQHGLTDSPL